MKVTLCSHKFGGGGGQENFLTAFARFLVEKGHRVRVLVAAGQAMPGVDLQLVPSGSGYPRAMRPWAQSRALAAALANDDHDVSFGQQKTWGCQVIRPGGGIEAEYWSGGPIAGGFAPLRRLSMKRFFDLRAERNGYGSPSLQHIIANSGMVLEALQRHYPEMVGSASLVCNGADLDRFARDDSGQTRMETLSALGLDPTRLTAVFAAHNFKLKGLSQAIDALARHAANTGSVPFQFLILGKGKPKPYHRQLQKNGLEESTRFVGATQEPEKFLRSSDVLLFPSFYDPCANVTIEALASGIPVITSRLNGASELLTPGREGWTVEHPGDIAAMAGHLHELENPETLLRMKRAARELAEKHSATSKFEAIEALLIDASESRKGRIGH